MKHEMILDREAGKVKIKVKACIGESGGNMEYKTLILIQPIHKRTWEFCYDPNNIKYKEMPHHEKRHYREIMEFKHVTPKEIHEAKLELWFKMIPREEE